MKLHEFDVTSQEFKNDPFPTLSRMRDAGAVVRTRLPILGKVRLVTTHAAVNDLLRNHHTFVREARNAGKSRFTDMQWWASWLVHSTIENMLSKDEPDHRRLRGLVDEAFFRRSVDSMEPRIHEFADQLLDQLVETADEKGVVDFVHFSRQFPLAVICELLGLPAEDRPLFTKWVSGFSTVKSLWGIFRALPGFLKIGRYFREQFRQCRAQPRDGLISLLVEAENAGDSLSENELGAMAFLLLFAGHETTTHLIGTGLLSLLDHPTQKDELTSDWSKVATAVEELHRFNTPVQLTKPRIAREDIEYFGQDVRRGEYVIAMLAAANSDPAQFDEPERLDICRSPNPHVGFGMGVHICLGMKLAQLETQIALQRLLTRFPNLELAIDRPDVRWNQRLGMRALKALPIRLNP